LSKNPSKNPAQKEPGQRPARKLGLDMVQMATLGGVVVVLAVSLLTWREIDTVQTRLDTRLAQIENRLAQVSSRVGTAAAQNPPQKRGPDPNRVYTINTTGAPVEGRAEAPVTITEFSDFQ
jgi:protein-disulfide isomerase